jgi:hypothetical protein
MDNSHPYEIINILSISYTEIIIEHVINEENIQKILNLN